MTVLQMTDTYRKAVTEIVNNHNGISAVPLALKTMESINPQKFSKERYDEMIQILLTEGEIIELEFEVPSQPNRLKSIFFPKGTKIGGIHW
jgi:hypothetical protein